VTLTIVPLTREMYRLAAAEERDPVTAKIERGELTEKCAGEVVELAIVPGRFVELITHIRRDGGVLSPGMYVPLERISLVRRADAGIVYDAPAPQFAVAQAAAPVDQAEPQSWVN
jgi:hypothetical protein